MTHNHQYTHKEIEYMTIALKEAEKAKQTSDYPIGAVLVINNKLIDQACNSINTEGNWYQHAEAKLLINNSELVKKEVKAGSFIELFTTLEPCLMCMGLAVLHRVNRITFACQDPHGGAGYLSSSNVNGKWYQDNWPVIRSGLLKNKSFGLMEEFIAQKTAPSRDRILKLFRQANSAE